MNIVKRYPIFLLALGVFGACNNAPEDAATTINETGVAAVETGKVVSLNNTAKWQADASTNNNVNLLQQTAAALNKGSKNNTVDYHIISNELQKGINQLVKECRMKGAEHDALHLWLEPLMAEIKELKTVTTTDTGDRLFYSIRTRLLDYNLYFQ